MNWDQNSGIESQNLAEFGAKKFSKLEDIVVETAPIKQEILESNSLKKVNKKQVEDDIRAQILNIENAPEFSHEKRARGSIPFHIPRPKGAPPSSIHRKKVGKPYPTRFKQGEKDTTEKV
ncbi:uncharacterized protein LOC111717069 [Eurytemora carolleeae]|uniref:uncharacterized protein LOC111717069 n=1 Tax=Eurytemora carolleeae TaxID=1294199 RepID=UPI000C7658E0|nr:uncharacterized protein LOC111717069 [Eurytemora carolleeae]|eukprot:XP_023348353.1 uncharacterized protein LOC111717069 [Eurytemora affinis]